MVSVRTVTKGEAGALALVSDAVVMEPLPNVMQWKFAGVFGSAPSAQVVEETQLLGSPLTHHSGQPAADFVPGRT